MYFFFFFNDTATTEIYTLSLHDALPISTVWGTPAPDTAWRLPRTPCLSIRHADAERLRQLLWVQDRKSTRLNSSHSQISYAVFCLKKKKYMKIGNITVISSSANLYYSVS